MPVQPRVLEWGSWKNPCCGPPLRVWLWRRWGRGRKTEKRGGPQSQGVVVYPRPCTAREDRPPAPEAEGEDTAQRGEREWPTCREVTATT